MKRPGPSSDSHSDSHACGPGRARTSWVTAVVLPEPAGATTTRMLRPSAASASVPSTRGRSMVPAPTGGTRVFEAMSPRGFDIGRSAVGVRVRNSEGAGVNNPFRPVTLQTGAPPPMDLA